MRKGKKQNSIPAWGTDETQAQQAFQANTKKSVRQSVRKKNVQVVAPSSVKALLYDEFKYKTDHMITYTQPFTKPVIYSAGGNVKIRWYVHFKYLYPESPDKYKLFRESFGMNKVKTYRERYAYAKEVQQFLLDKLLNGFNPFTDAIREPDQAAHGIMQQMEMIRLKMSKDAGEHRTKTYKEVYNRFAYWIDFSDLHKIHMHHITIDHVKDFKKWCIDIKHLNPKTINNTLSHLGMYWDLADADRIVNSNPFRQVPKVKFRESPVRENKQDRFEPIMAHEMTTIFEKMRKMNQHRFINFCAFIYYAWARPVEILRLRIMDIEMDRKLIRFKKGKTKNGTASYVQIVKPLEDIIRSMNLENYPPDYHLFSLNYEPGKKMLDSLNPTTRWREVVKVKIGINKDLYALKHTGNMEYLLNNKGNTDLKWQQMQNRHHSPTQTETYNKKIGAYFINLEGVIFRSI